MIIQLESVFIWFDIFVEKRRLTGGDTNSFLRAHLSLWSHDAFRIGTIHQGLNHGLFLNLGITSIDHILTTLKLSTCKKATNFKYIIKHKPLSGGFNLRYHHFFNPPEVDIIIHRHLFLNLTCSKSNNSTHKKWFNKFPFCSSPIKSSIPPRQMEWSKGGNGREKKKWQSKD